MQINGVGSGNSHNHSMHQVTECNHNQSVSKKSGGAAASSTQSALQNDVSQYRRQEGHFSLDSLFEKVLTGGKKLLLKIWGETPATDVTVENGEDEGMQNAEQLMAQMGEPDEGQSDMGQHMNFAAHEAMVGTARPQQTLHNNPYFSAIEDTGREKQSLWEKVRVRFQSVAGQLTGRFSNRNTFQTKQQKPREDLRKHSRYREDDLEIDCILTDDSYLLDSYDRKGEYSKLSAKK